MKSISFLLAVIFSGFLGTQLMAEEPVFDSIDYSSPEMYLAIDESLGDLVAIGIVR